jgi:ABC-type sulfate transport system permease component
LAGDGTADDLSGEVSFGFAMRKMATILGLQFLKPYNHWGIIVRFFGGLPYEVRNFRRGRGSVREEEVRAARWAGRQNSKAAAEVPLCQI